MQFMQGANGGEHGVDLQDDMLWLVAAAAQQQQQQRVLLRRRTGPELPAELRPGGNQFDRIDWCRSLLLNVVMHSEYQLTVVLCR